MPPGYIRTGGLMIRPRSSGQSRQSLPRFRRKMCRLRPRVRAPLISSLASNRSSRCRSLKRSKARAISRLVRSRERRAGRRAVAVRHHPHRQARHPNRPAPWEDGGADSRRSSSSSVSPGFEEGSGDNVQVSGSTYSPRPLSHIRSKPCKRIEGEGFSLLQ